MTPPRLVAATQAELDTLLVLAKAAAFPQPQYELLEGVLGTFIFVMQALQNAKTSLQRFRQMLFGQRTERTANVLGASGGGRAPEPGAPATAGTTTTTAVVAAGSPAVLRAGAPGKPRQGHGRHGAQAYQGATVVDCRHPTVQPGDCCPQCGVGKLYLAEPRTIVKVVGQVPLGATIYRRESWRCRLCEAIYTAPLPAGITARKYAPSCASMLAVLRYGSGLPFYRLEALQASLHVPLADATQWEIVERAATGPRLVFGELIRQAAQAELLHNDDTPGRILALMGLRRAKAEAAGRALPTSKAINTSGIVALLGQQKVILFFTGPAHAGQNLAQVLAQRAQELAAPLQMCDALAANVKGDLATILSHCLAHGRRKFVEVAEHFPEPCARVLEALAAVYRHDADCRAQQRSPAQRLDYHQEHSGPVLQELERWMHEQLEQRLVEPNSGLGAAVRYMLKHWLELTLFLRVAGAPLDNNICERALKKAIIHRKNSLFYRSQHGAEVGDLYMSLIYTCQSSNINPFEYLQALQEQVTAVAQNVRQWLPWNYRAMLTGSG